MHYQCMCCHFTFCCTILPKTTSSTSATVSDVFPRMPFTLTMCLMLLHSAVGDTLHTGGEKCTDNIQSKRNWEKSTVEEAKNNLCSRIRRRCTRMCVTGHNSHFDSSVLTQNGGLRQKPLIIDSNCSFLSKLYLENTSNCVPFVFLQQNPSAV